MPRTPLRPNYRFADCHSAAVGVHDRPQFAGAIFSASKAPSAAWSGLRRLALRCAAGALRCSGSWPCGRTHFARCTRYVQTSGHKSEHEAREYARGPGTLRFSATPIRPAQAALGALRAQGVLLGAGPGPLHAAPRAVRRWGDCAQPSSAAARGQSGVKRRTGEEAIYGHGPFRAVSRSASQPPRGASSAGHPQRSEGQALGAPAPYRPRGRATHQVRTPKFRHGPNTPFVPMRLNAVGITVYATSVSSPLARAPCWPACARPSRPRPPGSARAPALRCARSAPRAARRAVPTPRWRSSPRRWPCAAGR